MHFHVQWGNKMLLYFLLLSFFFFSFVYLLKRVHFCLAERRKPPGATSTDTSVRFTAINHRIPQKQLPRATIISAFQLSAAVTVTSNLTVRAKGTGVKHQRWMRGPRLRKWIIHQTGVGAVEPRGADDENLVYALKQMYAVISTLTPSWQFSFKQTGLSPPPLRQPLHYYNQLEGLTTPWPSCAAHLALSIVLPVAHTIHSFINCR